MHIQGPGGGAAAPSGAAREPAELVTLHVWRVPRRRVGAALRRVAVDGFAVRRAAGARFVKVLGTGTGRTFTMRDARPDRWALLVAWARAGDAAAFEDSPVPRRWAAISSERWRAELTPLAAHGRWARRMPFGVVPGGGCSNAPVAVLTRATLRWRTVRRFWRAVPPVAADLAAQPGLRFAMGIGERPVGVQGTFSVWDSAAAVRGFAYEGAAHSAAIRGAADEHWFSEQLFARFAVARATGTVDGRNPLEGAEWGERAAATR